MIHSLDSGAMRLTEGEAARMVTAILHLVGARVEDAGGAWLADLQCLSGGAE